MADTDNKADGYELDDDATIVKDSEYEPIEPGDYDFTIDYVERTRFNGSEKMPPCNQRTVTFKIHTDDGDKAIRENYPLWSTFEWKLSSLFASVGLKKKGEELKMDWGKLPGLTGRCKVTYEASKNDPNGKKYNHIGKLYAKEPRQFKAGSF